MSPAIRLLHLSDFHFSGAPEKSGKPGKYAWDAAPVLRGLARYIGASPHGTPDLAAITGDIAQPHFIAAQAILGYLYKMSGFRGLVQGESLLECLSGLEQQAPAVLAAGANALSANLRLTPI
jgi:3',5'-cyclic AMP phosphodiesterase CpdA